MKSEGFKLLHSELRNVQLTGLYTTSISGSSNNSSVVINTLALMEYISLRTLVRAGAAISLGDTMFLRECVRTPLISRSDSLHHRIGVVLNWVNERDRCDSRRAEDTKSQRGLSRRFWSGRVEDLQHDDTASAKIYAQRELGGKGVVRGRVALRIRRVRS